MRGDDLEEPMPNEGEHLEYEDCSFSLNIISKSNHPQTPTFG